MAEASNNDLNYMAVPQGPALANQHRIKTTIVPSERVSILV